MIDKDTVVRRNDGIISSQVEDTAVMMSIENGRYYGMDEIATAIWEKLKLALSVEQLIEELMNEYEVLEERCETEVVAFLNKLHDENLIIVMNE